MTIIDMQIDFNNLRLHRSLLRRTFRANLEKSRNFFSQNFENFPNYYFIPNYVRAAIIDKYMILSCFLLETGGGTIRAK